MANRLIGVGFVGIGAIILYLSLQLPQPIAATRIAYGAGFFPIILGVVITMAGLGLAILNPIDEFDEDEARESFSWDRFVQPAIVALAALAYILFSGHLGFLIIAPIILIGLLLMGRVPLVPALTIGLVGPILIYALFAKLLLVPLPLGLLAPLGAYL